MRAFPMMLALVLGPLAATALAAPPTPASAPTPPKAPSFDPQSTPPSAGASHAEPSPAAATKHVGDPSPLQIDIRRTRLANGLRVVLSVDRTSPTIAVDIVYDVGARNEKKGHSGFAHLFEHMMFQGSANVARGEHFRLVTAHGGTLNGTTNSDRTNYFQLMPQSELALALWLEADRMKSLDVSEKNFENQRAVVKEEYRMRIENAAYVPAEIRLQALVFQGYWPYEHSTIGTMEDLDAAQLDWVRAFHRAYYAPNNAVLAVAGDFDPQTAMGLIDKYFGPATPQPDVPPYDPGPMPEQTAPREEVVEDAHAKLPAVMYGWAIPPTGQPDHYALELAAMLLGDGESSRLYRVLVRERGLCADVDAETNNQRGPDWFELTCKVAGNATVNKADRLIAAQLDAVARVAPTGAEMNKLYNRARAHFLFNLQSNFGRAQKLAEFELYRGDATLLNTELSRYLAVTRGDIQRVVGQYLTKPRRSRVVVTPGGAETNAQPNAGEEK